MEEEKTKIEQSYEIAFQLISHAGDAKSKASQAIALANVGEYEGAKVLINEAKDEFKIAHQIQTTLIQSEADGQEYVLNIILVHAQDHFSMAMMSIEMAEDILTLNQKINELEKRIS